MQRLAFIVSLEYPSKNMIVLVIRNNNKSDKKREEGRKERREGVREEERGRKDIRVGSREVTTHRSTATWGSLGTDAWGVRPRKGHPQAASWESHTGARDNPLNEPSRRLTSSRPFPRSHTGVSAWPPERGADEWLSMRRSRSFI